LLRSVKVTRLIIITTAIKIIIIIGLAMELINDACSTSAIGCGVADISNNHASGDMLYLLLLGTSIG